MEKDKTSEIIANLDFDKLGKDAGVTIREITGTPDEIVNQLMQILEEDEK